MARGGLFLLGALAAALLVAAAGPIYSLAAIVVVIGVLLILRDIRWGLAALFAVIGLLPFAAPPSASAAVQGAAPAAGRVDVSGG